MKPVTLTYEKVLKAARKAYKEGRLGFQNKKRKCMYFYPGSKDVRCAVGAALPVRFKNMSYFPNGDGCAYLEDLGFIKWTNEDYRKIERLQMVHDEVCTYKGKQRQKILIDFKELLGV